jgi:hypothetical protein
VRGQKLTWSVFADRSRCSRRSSCCHSLWGTCPQRRPTANRRACRGDATRVNLLRAKKGKLSDEVGKSVERPRDNEAFFAGDESEISLRRQDWVQGPAIITIGKGVDEAFCSQGEYVSSGVCMRSPTDRAPTSLRKYWQQSGDRMASPGGSSQPV